MSDNEVPFNANPHLFVCAYSMADAARVCEEYFGEKPSYREMKDYWSADCWGKAMEGLRPNVVCGLSLDMAQNPCGWSSLQTAFAGV